MLFNNCFESFNSRCYTRFDFITGYFFLHRKAMVGSSHDNTKFFIFSFISLSIIMGKTQSRFPAVSIQLFH